MPWSIFSDGGGQGAALTWARDLLSRIGAPESASNVQFVYDWEVSEGGGGKYNPLNQGPVPGHPELTTTGSQYGGGAADFASWDAGITGASDYLSFSNFIGIKDALLKGDGAGARSALIASPWAASHYGGGSGFSDAPVPGRASALGAAGGAVGTGASSNGKTPGLNANPLDGFGIPAALGTILKPALYTFPVIIAGAALVVLGLLRATGVQKKAEEVTGI